MSDIEKLKEIKIAFSKFLNALDSSEENIAVKFKLNQTIILIKSLKSMLKNKEIITVDFFRKCKLALHCHYNSDINKYSNDHAIPFLESLSARRSQAIHALILNFCLKWVTCTEEVNNERYLIKNFLINNGVAFDSKDIFLLPKICDLLIKDKICNTQMLNIALKFEDNHHVLQKLRKQYTPVRFKKDDYTESMDRVRESFNLLSMHRPVSVSLPPRPASRVLLPHWDSAPSGLSPNAARRASQNANAQNAQKEESEASEKTVTTITLGL